MEFDALRRGIDELRRAMAGKHAIVTLRGRMSYPRPRRSRQEGEFILQPGENLVLNIVRADIAGSAFLVQPIEPGGVERDGGQTGGTMGRRCFVWRDRVHLIRATSTHRPFTATVSIVRASH